MRQSLKGLKPDTFEDIIALVALYRPGPMDNIPLYVDRKHERVEIDYPHPKLEAILKETYGVIIYQEQVMQIAQTLSGYSLGEADILRRAMGKKIKAEMDKQRGRFCNGAVERGIGEAKAGEIFDLVAKFASYGFNKSHAAAYALVAYQTAYLKANYPVEFMAATMTLDINNTDKLSAFKEELRELDIPLLLPDINKSAVLFSVEPAPVPYSDDPADPRQNLAIRYALAAIKGVGGKAMEAVVAERSDAGSYADLHDFAQRIDPSTLNKRQLEQLAAAGAFDSVIGDRARAYAAADMVLKSAQHAAEERVSAQVSLFGGEDTVLSRPALPAAKSWTNMQALEAERKAVGFYISAHPLDDYAKTLRREGVKTAEDALSSVRVGEEMVKLAGAIDSFRVAQSRKTNRRFGALTLSDQSRMFEILVFEDDLEHARSLVDAGGPVLAHVQIRLRKGEEEPRLSARDLSSLADVASRSETGLVAMVEEASAFDGISACLKKAQGGHGEVWMRLPVKNLDAGNSRHTALFKLPGKYRITPELNQAIAAEMGVLSVEEH